MTYFLFLTIFLGLPLVILLFLAWHDDRNGYAIPLEFKGLPVWLTIFVHVFAALFYTTPWDNYLVAKGIWYYNPEKVTGSTIGWVPLEEYIFFILQTIVTGLWLRFLIRHLRVPKGRFEPNSKARWLPLVALSILWFVALFWLITEWSPGTYLALILVWALPPIGLQFVYGGDILRYHWRLILLVVLVPTIYLSLADSLAISTGIWTISPGYSLNIYLGGVLPLEEFIFFLMTNSLISMGSCLFLASISHDRMRLKFPNWPVKPVMTDGIAGYE